MVFLGTCSQSLNLTQLVSDQPRFPEVSDCCNSIRRILISYKGSLPLNKNNKLNTS